MLGDYILLPKQQVDQPEVLLFTLDEFRQRRDIVESLESGVMALDYESNGYDWKKEDFSIRTVGLANEDFCISIDLLGADEDSLIAFKKWIIKRPYVAHNVSFEAGATLAWAGSIGIPVADTYILFADLATEYRRPWNLDTAMADLLGLAKEGDLVKDHMKANKWTWSDVDKFDFPILGHYNAVDAYGHWKLYKYFERIIASYNDSWGAYYWDYHQQDCLSAVTLEVETREGGIHIDTTELEVSYQDLSEKRDTVLANFLGLETVAPHIASYNTACLAELVAAKPEEFTKTGKPAARYIKWKDKMEAARGVQHFNTNSTHQLRWLFFDMMNLPIGEYTAKGEPSTSKEVLKVLGVPGKLLLEYRDYVTKLKFVTQIRDGLVGDRIHPTVRVFATISTRSGGAKLG